MKSNVIIPDLVLMKIRHTAKGLYSAGWVSQALLDDPLSTIITVHGSVDFENESTDNSFDIQKAAIVSTILLAEVEPD